MEVYGISPQVLMMDRPTPLTTAVQGLEKASAQLRADFDRLNAGDISPERMASVMEASFIYSMNIQLIKIADEMTGQVIDLIA